MNQVLSIGPQVSFLLAMVVLFLGQWVNKQVPLLQRFSIPEPIAVSYTHLTLPTNREV